MNRIKKIFSIAILSIAVCTAAIADEVDYDNANAILTKYCGRLLTTPMILTASLPWILFRDCNEAAKEATP